LYDFPEVRSFLLDGEAECYKGITVDFVYGQDAVLTIGRKTQLMDEMTGRVLEMMIEEESIPLIEYDTKEELHALFQSKGFHKRLDDEQFDIKKNRLEKQKRELDSTHHKMLTSTLVHRKYPNEDELKEKIHEKELEIMIIEEKMKDLVKTYRK